MLRLKPSMPLVFWLTAFLTYLGLFFWSIHQQLFEGEIFSGTFNLSSSYTTDDALQQLFPFNDIFNDKPIFTDDDLISRAMKGYLTPLHRLLTTLSVFITGDVIRGSHLVFLVQLFSTLLFLFLGVKSGCKLQGVSGIYSVIPALFSMIWFLHTRNVVQRLSVGLVRGWAAPVLAAGVYFMLARNHSIVLLTLLIGTSLHPPATFLLACTYGLLCVLDLKKDRKRFFTLLLLSPLYALLAYYTVKMPASLGKMAYIGDVINAPEFQNPGGRFPFVPLPSIIQDLRIFAFQPFLSKWVRLRELDYLVMAMIGGALLGVFLHDSNAREKPLMPKEGWCFLLAIAVVYTASRTLAFYLYVPNRHLQFPLTFFFVIFIPIILSRFRSSLPFLLLSIIVYLTSGHGLYGLANLNWHRNQRGGAFQWIRQNTPTNSLIAGHPTFVDPVLLFGNRRAYVTTETAHPFYNKYYEAIRPRIIASLKMHYAPNLKDLYDEAVKARVTHVVLERARFYPEALREATYDRPYDVLVKELTNRPPEDFAYRQIPSELSVLAPYQVYRDREAVVIDVSLLGAFLRGET